MLKLKLSHYTPRRRRLGEGGIAPTHSRPRHQMGVIGQRYTPVALKPRGKDPRYLLYRKLGGPQSRYRHKRIEEKSCRLCRGSNLDRPVVQPVVTYYTDWATRLTKMVCRDIKTCCTKICKVDQPMCTVSERTVELEWSWKESWRKVHNWCDIPWITTALFIFENK
jgi:hypothetical protein